MALQRDTYGRFLFGGREGVGFVFSSVEFQSNQHLGHSFLLKKKKRKKKDFFFFLMIQCVENFLQTSGSLTRDIQKSSRGTAAIVSI